MPKAKGKKVKKKTTGKRKPVKRGPEKPKVWTFEREHLLEINLMQANLNTFKEAIPRRNIEADKIVGEAKVRADALRIEAKALQMQITALDQKRAAFFASLSGQYGGIDFTKPGVIYDDVTGVITVRKPEEKKK